MYNLKINGQQADLDNTFNVTLSYDSIDVINPISRGGGFTYTINIPRTKRNNKIFGHIVSPDVIDKFQTDEFDATLDYNNRQIINGIFYLDTITDNYYQGSIVSDVLNWTKYIPDTYISEITGNTISFPATSAETPYVTVKNYLLSGNSDNSDINFPLHTYGNYNYGSVDQPLNSIISKEYSTYINSGHTVFAYDDLNPSFYYINSIKNCFTYNGLNVECTLFNTLKDLMIPYCGREDFAWNWGTLGTCDWTYNGFVDTPTIDYFYSFNGVVYNHTDGKQYRGRTYKCRASGTLLVYIDADDIHGSGCTIFKGDEQGVDIYYSTNAGSTLQTVEVSKGDVLLLTARGTFGDSLTRTWARYIDLPTEINVQKILPDIKQIDWIKNFITYFGLYPYYNIQNNTVYLLTLDEFLKRDDFKLSGIENKELKKYGNGSIGLKYTFDPKDGLVTENEFDYLRENNLQILFAPSKQRTFNCSNIISGTNTNVNLISIASKEAINSDRLRLDLIATIDYQPWSSVSAYTTGDKVTYQERYFVAKRPNTNQDPVVNQWWYWAEDFTPNIYQTDLSFEYITRIVKFDGNVTSASTGNYINILDRFKLFFATSSFPDELSMNEIYNNYYRSYISLINNRTSVIEGTAYIPIQKFVEFFNRPVEINYFNDTYILLGINGYNPITEFGKIKLIKKITYTDTL